MSVANYKAAAVTKVNVFAQFKFNARMNCFSEASLNSGPVEIDVMIAGSEGYLISFSLKTSKCFKNIVVPLDDRVELRF